MPSQNRYLVTAVLKHESTFLKPIIMPLQKLLRISIWLKPLAFIQYKQIKVIRSHKLYRNYWPRSRAPPPLSTYLPSLPLSLFSLTIIHTCIHTYESVLFLDFSPLTGKDFKIDINTTTSLQSLQLGHFHLLVHSTLV